MTEPSTTPAPRRPQIAKIADARPRIALTALMAANSELVIEHDGQEYLLRLTSNGKLLLTK